VLSIMFGLCPVVFKLLAAGIVWRYPLTADRQAEVRREIAAQRSA
jgi:Na+/melibiose symporter-like transporter